MKPIHRRLRAFLGLRQKDVERATGIPIWKLSAAEAGRIRLDVFEEELLATFLYDRMRIVVKTELEIEAQSSGGTAMAFLRGACDLMEMFKAVA